MKTISKVVIIFSILLLLLSISYYQNRFYLKTEKTIVHQDLENNNIAIIGDSWVAHNKLDSLLKAKTGRKVISYGQSGARSSTVYENLLKGDILKQSPEYCLVISGVNDMAQMSGSEYYAYHNTLIIKLLLANNIKPIVVSVPEINMEEVYNTVHFLSEIRTKLLAKIKGSYAMNPKEKYREEFVDQLKKGGVYSEVIIIDFDKITPTYTKEYFKDFTHLNSVGKYKLIEVVSETLN